MKIRNEISLPTNQVVFSFTNLVLSGLLVPLFLIVLLLEGKPFCQTRNPGNWTQALILELLCLMYLKMLEDSTIRQRSKERCSSWFGDERNLIVQQPSGLRLVRSTLLHTLSLSRKVPIDSYRQNQILYDESNTLF